MEVEFTFPSFHALPPFYTYVSQLPVCNIDFTSIRLLQARSCTFSFAVVDEKIAFQPSAYFKYQKAANEALVRSHSRLLPFLQNT